jgi:cytochrome c553
MYSISLAAGNIDAGKTKSASCAACHGNNGVSAQDLYPNLAGQKARYIVKQLRAFESGARPEPTMAAMASVLSDVDMADLAAYYSSLVPRQQPALSTAPPTASSQAAEADLKNERPEGSAQIALTCPLGQAMYVHAPKTLNRLSKEEYKRTIWDLVGEQTAISLPALAGIIEGIPDDDVSAGFSNIDWSLSTDHVAGYLGVANELGVQIVKKKALRDKVIPCSKGGEHVTSELCISGFIDSFGARAYRRPLEQVEKQRLLTFYHGHSASNPDLALSSLVTRILMSPHFLFRHETAPPRESASCNQSLRTESFIRAARLSYGLWGSMPDGRLFSAASDNELLHESKLTNEIERMLADPKARSWLSQFFRQWLHYDHLAVEAYSLPFIGDIDRAHLHENAAEELDSFIDYVVWKERGNFARLMTSRKVITTSSALREIYELPRPHI